jgi:hypothetical protein
MLSRRSNFLRLSAAAIALFFYAAPTQAQNACGMQLGGPPIFCDTFDAKNPGIQSRTGDLDPNVWGVSRIPGGGTNFGQGQSAVQPPVRIQMCDGTTPAVTSPKDVVICNGQLREASNDNPTLQFDAGGVTALAMYPKQPFDWAGRTGTVSFDLSNDTQGEHAAWPEFWISDLPVPAPFTHSDPCDLCSVPQNGFGIRFDLGSQKGNAGLCPNGGDTTRWGASDLVIVSNYVDKTYSWGQPNTRIFSCVKSAPGPNGPLNHVEIRVSQNQVELWGSDAGSKSLQLMTRWSNINLPLTRGLIWLEDVHYNADKGIPPGFTTQREHTWTWDNVAFDGPFTYRDFSYDALDDATPYSGNGYIAGSINLGKTSDPGRTSSWNVLNLPANPNAAAVRVLFTTEDQGAPSVVNVIVNGHAHTEAWPFPNTGWSPRPHAVTIPVTDLVPGTNVVQIGADKSIATSNVNIVLVAVPGGVPDLPGSNNAYPGTGTTSASNGVCGSAAGSTVTSAPTANLCVVGAASTVSGTGPWSWTCAGTNGGTTASCSANKASTAVNGACGNANGKPVQTAPRTGLCAAGLASLVTGAGPWTWTCGGTGGGSDASCSAPVASVCTVVCR